MRPPNGDVLVTDDVPGAFAAQVRQAFAARPAERFALVLSGGPTARRCYERLAADPGDVDFGAVDVFMGDERCVPPDDDDANQRLVRQALLERVGHVGSFHPMACTEGAEAYERILLDHPPPDLVHLGMGADGHTASLFPDSAALEEPGEHLVLESDDPHARNPHPRMTLTLAAIARARLALFTVAGEEKRDAFARVCGGADLPAARVRAGRVLWLVDPAACGATG